MKTTLPQLINQRLIKKELEFKGSINLLLDRIKSRFQHGNI